jgi:hypothetical protein
MTRPAQARRMLLRPADVRGIIHHAFRNPPSTGLPLSWARWLLLGDIGQQMDLNEVREQLERLRAERDLAEWDLSKVREVADELDELELRHGMLVRLLVSKGLITAEEYASLISAARPEPAERRAAEPDRGG